jgi:aspartate carbamoyltransferase catalytic subunit
LTRRWTRKDLLGIAELSVEEIELLLDTAESFTQVAERPIKKVPTLRGKTVINLFFENSTRTRSSFEIAAKRMSADAINFSTSSSSVAKGESLIDTALNLEAMAPDVVVIRHAHPFAPHLLARRMKSHIVNAGDGAHEHPTQALLDAFTIRRHKGRLAGLEVAIVGDIEHSRVVRSNIHLLSKMGAKVTVAGPRTMMPEGIETLGCTVSYDLDQALFGLNVGRLKQAKPDVIVLHPGPINRGVEIASEVADGPYSVILEQVSHGVALRMAVLYLLTSMGEEAA